MQNYAWQNDFLENFAALNMHRILFFKLLIWEDTFLIFFPWCLWGSQWHHSIPDKKWKSSEIAIEEKQPSLSTPYSGAKWQVWTLPRWQIFGYFPQKELKWEKNRENLEICYFRNLSEHNLKQLGCPFSYVQHDFPGCQHGFQAQQLKNSSGETS